MVRDKVRILTPYIYSSFQNLPIYVRVGIGISYKSKILVKNATSAEVKNFMMRINDCLFCSHPA